ncbi:M15 family metallopeptidase [Nocardioides sp. InS609-2]|uniref:M15 family metallopeptidase n=1 Tax=Nocardioides sp. InS609-2 TaxID=2760705 RepID=UPI0020BDC70C|nr:M15 family metallopeptidase [Nocardioides sp. InS609-2]
MTEQPSDGVIDRAATGPWSVPPAWLGTRPLPRTSAITGGSAYSQHAYGLAIDVNTFQNPYVKDDVALPELASSYLRRDRVRPGMLVTAGPVIRAFAAIGWEWGGNWRTLKDLQHFSLTDR